MKEYYESSNYLSLSKKSQYGIRKDIEVFCDYLALDPKDFTKEYMERLPPSIVSDFLLTSYTMNKKPATLRRYKYSLGRAFGFYNLVEHYKAIKNFVVRNNRTSNTEKDNWLNKKEIDHLLAVAKESNSIGGKALIYLMVLTGLRISEALNIRICDIDFNEPRVLEDGEKIYKVSIKKAKFNKDRVIFINQLTADALKEVINKFERPPNNQMIFFNKKSQKLYSDKWAYRESKKILNEAGFKDTNPHKLRHSCASLMIKNKVPYNHVAQVLGHSSYKTTMDVYAHVNAEEDVADALANAIYGQLNKNNNQEKENKV